MLTRRGFAACALCAVAGFVATGAHAQTAGLKRVIIRQTDGAVEGYVTVEMRVEIEADADIARHTHPGIESSYVVEGSTELTVDGQGTRVYAAGEGWQVPTGVPHSGKNGPAKTVVAATYVIDKSKPLASPA